MLEVILDTETTGLSVQQNHRIVEIGCIEISNHIPTNNIFHHLINPEREISEEALKVHGYTKDFLSDKKVFKSISDDFLNFIKNKKLIIHNAAFDLSFLNYELKLCKKNEIKKEYIVDTLEIARTKFPGSQNSLDALCKRFKIDNSRREKHNALLDCRLLLEVYINLVDQKEPKLNFENVGKASSHSLDSLKKQSNYSKEVVNISADEIEKHKLFLKTHLKKNFFK
jgi:DNA polymerase III subunit epsilon